MECDLTNIKGMVKAAIQNSFGKFPPEVKEDLEQQALLIQLEYWKKRGHFKTVIFSVLDAARIVLGDKRKIKNQGTLVPLDPKSIQDPRSEIEEKQLRDFIISRFETEIGKEVARLVLQGYNYDEIGAVYGISSARVCQIIKTHSRKKRYKH